MQRQPSGKVGRRTRSRPAAAGAEVRALLADDLLWEFRQGRATAFRQYTDTAAFAAATA